MDHPSKLVIGALLALLGASAHAGYAQAVPPAGFSQIDPAASTGRWGYAKAANEAWTSSTVRTTASLNVGGRTVTMPAAMRFATNAPRYAAGILFLNPYLRTGIAVAGWLGLSKIIWDEVNKQWVKQEDVENDPPGIYSIYPDRTASSYDAACSQMQYYVPEVYVGYEVVPYTEYGYKFLCIGKWRYADSTTIHTLTRPINFSPAPCPSGTQAVDGKCKGVQNRPLTKEEFERELAPEVWRPENPGTVPEKFHEAVPPGTPLPVEIPVINPRYVPLPQTTPTPNPYFWPSGDPYPNPNFNPNAPVSPENQPYIQPGVRIKPSPTLDEPWRVDVEPVNRPQTEPNPKPDNELNPGPLPPPNPEDEPNPEDPPDKNDQKKPEDQASLCEKHPDIIACAKMDEVEPEDVQNEQKDLSITPTTGWETGAGTCPAPVTRQVAGLTLEMQWQPFCDLATGIRPVILALAWIAAAMMVIGVARRGE